MKTGTVTVQRELDNSDKIELMEEMFRQKHLVEDTKGRLKVNTANLKAEIVSYEENISAISNKIQSGIEEEKVELPYELDMDNKVRIYYKDESCIEVVTKVPFNSDDYQIKMEFDKFEKEQIELETMNKSKEYQEGEASTTMEDESEIPYDVEKGYDTVGTISPKSKKKEEEIPE